MATEAVPQKNIIELYFYFIIIFLLHGLNPCRTFIVEQSISKRLFTLNEASEIKISASLMVFSGLLCKKIKIQSSNLNYLTEANKVISQSIRN